MNDGISEIAEYRLMIETDRAYCIRDGIGNDHWLPKSQVMVHSIKAAGDRIVISLEDLDGEGKGIHCSIADIGEARAFARRILHFCDVA